MQDTGTPTPPPLRVTLVQTKPKKADVAGNLAVIRDRWLKEIPDADIVVFPEASLTGYFLEGGVADVAVPVEEVAAGLGKPGPRAANVVLGFYERWQRGIYNSVACFEPDGDEYRAIHVHRKMFLPSYGVFEEARFADPGTELAAFDSRFGRMGMLVCEEMWHSLPATILALDGAELILVVSASPAREFREGLGRSENLARWDALAQGTAQEHGVFVGVCQLVGSEGGKVFLGGSIAVGPDGSILGRGPLMEEGLISADMSGKSIERARFESPLLADLRQMLPHLQRSLNRAGTGESRQAETQLAGGGSFRPTAQSPKPGVPVPALDMALIEKILVEFIREEVV
ncbi:MAG: hypothetical protein KJN92_17190, partial [Gemmatimonadetes bacterium]|nr:hypothetical protein [Gemmatimonadota bacterium]